MNGLRRSQGMTRWKPKEAHMEWIFTPKTGKKKHKALTHGLPRWQSVCSHFDPTDARWDLMIGSKEGPGSFGASNKLGNLEASLSNYKYKHPHPHDINISRSNF
ncbi:hypothetical protein Tco_0162448 [Tanacetum coccineum]